MTPGQSRAARGLLGWSQGDLAEASKVSRPTITDFEAGRRTPYARTMEDLHGAFEAAGVIFIERNGEAEGVRLRKER